MQPLLRNVLAATLVLILGSFGAAQAVAGPAEKFAELHKQYLALDGKLSELMKLYYDPQIPAREPIVKEYGKLVEKANSVLAELRKEGIAAFEAEPNKDSKITRVLLGLVHNDLRKDQYESANELAQTLLAKECSDKALLDLAGQAAYALDNFEAAEKLLTEAKEAKTLTAKGKANLEDIPVAKERWAVEQDLRQKEAEGDLPRVKLETSQGDIVVELFENEAPQTVGNFVSLVEGKKYDGTTFHRVLPGFMAQGGDPKGDGTGGPGYHILCECFEPNHRNHFRGTLSMAHAGKDTGGQQFFLTFVRAPQLDGKHTVFGRVIEGLDVLAKIKRRDPNPNLTIFKLPEPDKIVKATVVRKRDHVYEPTKAPDAKDKKGKPGEKKDPDKKQTDDKKDSEKQDPDAKAPEKKESSESDSKPNEDPKPE